MRFGLQARFIAILLLATAIALAGVFQLHRQLKDRDAEVAQAVQNLIDIGGVRQANQEQMLGEITARIDAANHSYRLDLSLTVFVLGLLFAGVAWLGWQGLVRPILGLAEMARRIEAGDEVSPLPDSQRDDEIGDLACAFNTLNDALLALRQRMDHDADLVEPPPRPQPQPQPVAPSAAETTMVMSPPKPAAPPPPPPPTAQELERLRRLEDDLREAWQRGEMSVLYQPIHSVANGSMRGAEALLRWQHRFEGQVSPAEFIPMAERSDIILGLGRHVLVQACSDASLWPGDGTAENSPFISVNVAERQLRDPPFFEYVVEALRKSGLAASRLHLEMPVAILRDGDPVIEAMIEQLRGLGVQIWLDATGADASDQDRWMKAPVSGVKVGRSRIQDKKAQAEDAASTGAIVATARALRIAAAVVGVEELSELNVLKEQGADLAQGYVLCKPVGTAEIGRRLLA
ncbi:MAG TPA: EAL domain-containing protein [Xanthomonadaceae bacterium]|jgi:EAL domain-containing protein (putative c-di-GMP-specific phosphodiesterase class I)/HAMP domain-containing protein